jgi:hypothetical protein
MHMHMHTHTHKYTQKHTHTPFYADRIISKVWARRRVVAAGGCVAEHLRVHILQGRHQGLGLKEWQLQGVVHNQGTVQACVDVT